MTSMALTHILKMSRSVQVHESTDYISFFEGIHFVASLNTGLCDKTAIQLITNQWLHTSMPWNRLCATISKLENTKR